MQHNQHHAHKRNEPLTQIHQPPGTAVRHIDVPRADLLAYQNGSGVGESGEETDDQALQCAEYR